MASPEQNAQSLLTHFSVPALVVVVGLLFAGQAYAPRYAGARPATADLEPPSTLLGRCEGWMSEDPLELLERRLGVRTTWTRNRPPKDAVHDPLACRIDGCPLCVQERIARENATGRVLLLFENLPTSGSPDDAERRIRARQATLYALLHAGYEPETSSSIGFFYPPSGGEPIAYEHFVPDRRGMARYRLVTLVWLAEDADGGRPLSYVRDVAAALTPKTGAAPDLRVVGPTSSGDLLELLDDEAWDHPAELPAIHVLSPYATAASIFGQRLRERTKGSRVTICPTIGTDRALARLLVAELCARIPALMRLDAPPFAGDSLVQSARLLPPNFFSSDQGEPIKVAVVAEGNTPYGRAWIDNLEWARDQIVRELGPGARGPVRKVRFEPVTFVSPIDGPGAQTGGESDGSTDLDVDYPAGAKQIDYLRRIESELENRQSSGTYAAIGIFGTDVYDKLMIIEALRPRFPHAIFFTTDLDARFLHPHHLPYTRNMVVASQEGLRLSNEPLQFRDIYQTSVFRAVEAALAGRDRRSPGAGQLYEIGTDRAVPLDPPWLARVRSAGEDEEDPRALASTVSWLERLHVSPVGVVYAGQGAVTPDPGPWSAWGVWACLLGTAAVAVGPTRWRRRKAAPRQLPATAKERAWILPVLLTLLCAALGWWLHDRVTRAGPFAHEPTSFFEGVSVWPAILIRLMILFFCLLATLWTHRTMRRVMRELRREYGLGEATDVSGSGRRAGLFSHGTRTPIHLATVWSRLEAWLANRWTWARLLGYAVVIYCLAAPFYAVFHAPPVPARGEPAYVAERWTLLLSLIAFFMLVAYVLELTILAVRLIRRSTDQERTILPTTSLARRSNTTEESLEKDPDFRKMLQIEVRLDLVRDLTQEVGRLVYAPMLAVCLLIFARASLFDSWSWPGVLVGTLLVFFALLLLCVVLLRDVAKKARRQGLRELEGDRLRLATSPDDSRRLEIVRGHVEALRGGAFSPLAEHPIVRTAFLPVAAMVTTALLDGGWTNLLGR